MIDSTQKDKLIDKIRQIEDPEIFNEIQRLLEIEFEDKPFKTNDEQKKTYSEPEIKSKKEKSLMKIKPMNKSING